LIVPIATPTGEATARAMEDLALGVAVPLWAGATS